MNVQPDDANLPVKAESPMLIATGDPRDFLEGGGDHRKSILANTALMFVLLIANSLEPVLFGISVSPTNLWMCLGLAHVYFFVMWRLTSKIEQDRENRFWNWKGLWKQARLGGTESHPGKTKAQIIMIRALPIWAFFGGLVMVVVGLWRA